MQDCIVVELGGVCQSFYLLVIVKKLEEFNDKILIIKLDGTYNSFFDEAVDIFPCLIVGTQEEALLKHVENSVRISIYHIHCPEFNQKNAFALIIENWHFKIFKHFPRSSSRQPMFRVPVTQVRIHSLLNFFSLRMVLLLSSCKQ